MYGEDLSLSTPGLTQRYYTVQQWDHAGCGGTTVTTLTAPRLHRENCGQVLLVVVVVGVYSGLDLDDVERLTFFMILSLSVISSYQKLPESRKYLQARPTGGYSSELRGGK